MARKPSIIMSAAERKEAKTSLKAELKDAKERVKAAKASLKVAERTLKDAEKELLGLKTRLDALTPPKAVATV